MARFYSNENFPLPTVEALRILDHDVRTVKEAGKSNQTIPDEAVLQFAHSQNRAVLTINRKHFIRLHKDNPEHSGIIVCTYDPNFSEQAGRINAIVSEQETITNLLLRVNRPIAESP